MRGLRQSTDYSLSEPYWVIQDYEEFEEYKFFLFYLMLGPYRNIGLFLTKNGDPNLYDNQKLYELSVLHQWDRRAASFDDEITSTMLLPGYEDLYKLKLDRWIDGVEKDIDRIIGGEGIGPDEK